MSLLPDPQCRESWEIPPYEDRRYKEGGEE